MWRILGALALVSGCLLAPSRPGDPIGGDCMLPSEDAQLTVAAVFPSADGDVLVRAGLDRGMQRVNFYDPSAQFSPICATRSVELTPIGGLAVDRVVAITRMTDQYLLVLIERSDGTAAVYQIDVSTEPPELTPTAISSAANIEPVRALPSPFVAYSETAQEVWFGGPVIHRSLVAAGFGGASTFTSVTGHMLEGWYLAASTNGIPGSTFTIIGQRADYAAVSGSGTSIQTEVAGARDASCDANLMVCADRIARAVTTGPPSVGLVPGLSFTRDGDITAVRTDGAVTLMRRDVIPGGGILEDVALHELDATGSSPPVDVVALVDDGQSKQRTVQWHADAFLTNPLVPTAEYMIQTGGEPEHLVVGVFVPGDGPKILVLDDQPGQPDPGGDCLQVVGGSLVPCSFPAR